VIDNAPIGMLSVDARGQLEHANPKLLAILGSTYTEFTGSFSVVDEGAAKKSGFAALLERALRTGEVLADQFSFDSWWGRRLTTRTLVAPRRNAAGDVVGALAIVEDVTERLAIESRLQEAQRLEAIGQLAAGVAHEINNPMAYVRSNLTMLREEIGALAKEADSAEQPDQTRARIAECGLIAENCLGQVERTVSIVRDLREFSRGGSADRELTDVNALLENAARLGSTRTGGLSEIPLQLAEVPPISAAPGQLRQLFLNLLLNALRAAGPTGRVSAETTRTAGELLVSVHDDGPVIQPAERARLFEPFAPCRGSGGDPGLGLYISQQIAREHHGKIEVLSSAEHGTRFIVRLPIPLAER
jgi:PAS domain S-box-containing protein